MTGVVLEWQQARTQHLQWTRGCGSADGLHLAAICWLKREERGLEGTVGARRIPTCLWYLMCYKYRWEDSHPKKDLLPKEVNSVQNLVSNLFLPTEQSWLLEIAQERMAVTISAFLAAEVSALSWHFLWCYKNQWCISGSLHQPPNHWQQLWRSHTYWWQTSFHVVRQRDSLFPSVTSLCVSVSSLFPLSGFWRGRISEETMESLKGFWLLLKAEGRKTILSEH